MHDAALEPLIDEVVVGRIVCRVTGRRAPDLEIQPWQEVLLARLIGERVVTRHRRREGLEVVDRLTFKRVGGDLLRKRDDCGVVIRIAHRWRGRHHGWIWARIRAAVDLCVRHEAGVQEIERLDRAIRLLLHHESLKDLDWKSDELELLRHWITKRRDPAPSLEEVPEG